MSHLNATLLPNNTVSGGTVAHVGQMFFDQSLLTQVTTVEPYASNTQQQTTNAQDNIMEGASEGDDPVLEYVFLGSSVAQGIFGWINVGIDPGYARNVSAAATFSSEGGYKNPSSGGMGGGPGGVPPPGSSGFPSGLQSAGLPSSSVASAA